MIFQNNIILQIIIQLQGYQNDKIKKIYRKKRIYLCQFNQLSKNCSARHFFFTWELTARMSWEVIRIGNPFSNILILYKQFLSVKPPKQFNLRIRSSIHPLLSFERSLAHEEWQAKNNKFQRRWKNSSKNFDAHQHGHIRDIKLIGGSIGSVTSL